MPPKRRSSGPATKSQQSTLAFHGASNKVTKAGTRAQAGKKNIVPDVTTKQDVKPDVVNIEEEPTTAEAAIIDQTKDEVEEAEIEIAPQDIEARRVTDAAIKMYWAAKEKQRMAPRVHQQDLSLHEKILREFDMSGHYGPCTGIARLKRWKRAYRLDLDPPIEVLAVLLKEMDIDSKVELQRSQVDELLNSKVKVEST
ncbi:hypothetical protein EK21DRAFT_98763 [Setomelanomma holmii]|uniref:DNA polymerase delta subunit 4 n=1 Tax=Setomelanomma holmii TaxID=210430 RepID=A0A9P4LMG1_9PLEO|nr:hypothetical protein EK21DRAFT_98763 [Setomelanomma holmii]